MSIFRFFESRIANTATLVGLFLAGGVVTSAINHTMENDYRKESTKRSEAFAQYCSIYALQLKTSFTGDPEAFKKQLRTDLEDYLNQVIEKENHKEYQAIIDEIIKLN